MSASATLRPLFRNFLEATNNLTSSAAGTGHWNARASRAGYLRSDGNESIGLNLRSNDNKTATLTTTIKAGSMDDEVNESQQVRTPGRKRSEGKKGKGGNWKDDDTSEETDWSRGITKTMEVRTNNEMV